MNRYDYSQGFSQRAAISLADPELGNNLKVASDGQVARRVQAMTSLKEPGSLMDAAAAIKDSVLSKLDLHLEELATNWERNGGTVFFAADADEAASYVVRVGETAGVTAAVKSKSMASEEIGLNRRLIEAGIEPVETDLGEFIIQLAGEHPSHIITPAIHRSKADVADLFSRLSGERLPPETEALGRFARSHLRSRFLSAGMGINGVNFGISQAGALCMVTNEGNGRLCASVPPIQVAIMGMERVLGDWDQLAVMLALLARSATGQKITQYTNIMFGPRSAGEYDGPIRSHLVILDNGRSGALAGEQRSILRCIRCGACLNVCPVYRQVGGHAYDPVYSGPIGAVLNPTLRPESAELAHASTLCGACTEVCPVRIPLHELLVSLRHHYAEDAPRSERAAYRSWAYIWTHPWAYRSLRSGARLLKRRSVKRLKKLPLPLIGRWTRTRGLPTAGIEDDHG